MKMKIMVERRVRKRGLDYGGDQVLSRFTCNMASYQSSYRQSEHELTSTLFAVRARYRIRCYSRIIEPMAGMAHYVTIAPQDPSR